MSKSKSFKFIIFNLIGEFLLLYDAAAMGYSMAVRTFFGWEWMIFFIILLMGIVFRTYAENFRN